MDLYSVTVLFKHSPNIARLLFKRAESAQAVFDLLATAAIKVSVDDDYHKSLFVHPEDISAISKAHINEELNATADEQILQTHGQIKLQKRAKQDPEIAAEMRTSSQLWQPGAQTPNGQFRQ